jgi:hypothetical protein
VTIGGVGPKPWTPPDDAVSLAQDDAALLLGPLLPVETVLALLRCDHARASVSGSSRFGVRVWR